MLQKDGRMTYKDIAKEVGVNLHTVRDRIRKLIEFGVICSVE
ncbi:MAG: winged helix-turn-helix transcriptional regulator [Nitrososphaerota archaeon]|nr:winged helix-turn-helix transcriptional regulator [Nitrososphaerota archaeon]